MTKGARAHQRSLACPPLLPDHLIFVDEKLIVEEMFHDFLSKVRCVNALVEMTLSCLFQTFPQCHRCFLQPVVRNFGEKEMMYNVTVHHVMTHAVDPLAVVAVHSFKSTSCEVPRVVGVQIAVV